jgi:hypothetical protein
MWVAYESVSDENIYQGIEQATGSALRPLYHFDNARVILALDGDPLQTDSDNLRNTAGYASGRNVQDPHGSMSRLWAVEGVHSLTGANADHRLRLASSKIGQFVSALGARLGVLGMSASMPDGIDAGAASHRRFTPPSTPSTPRSETSAARSTVASSPTPPCRAARKWPGSSRRCRAERSPIW